MQRFRQMCGRILGWVDRRVIGFAAARMPMPGRREPHLAEAAQLLAQRDFFHDFIAPAVPEFVSERRFHFASPVQTPFERNNRVAGRLYRCGPNWREKPAVILLHGWSDPTSYFFRYPFAAWLLNRAGINAAIIALPYHFERRPPERGAIHNIISEDLLRTVEAIRQGVADIRATAAWLRQEGCPSVGVWGFSMGAWFGGLALCHEPQLGFGILMTPVVLMDRCIEEIEFAALVRHSLKCGVVDFAQLNLIAHKPLVPLANLLLAEAQYDAFVPRETVESLWEKWNRPEIWRLPHGHISALGSPGLLSRAVKWLKARSPAPVGVLRDTNRLPSK